MRGLRSAQRGAGMPQLLVNLTVVIVLGTLLFKLGPAYLQFQTVKGVMNGVAQLPEPILGGRGAILTAIEKRLAVNEVRGLESKSFNVKSVGETNFEVRVEYERREHLFFNIDAVMRFDYTVLVKGR